jgi:hypothetical protein
MVCLMCMAVEVMLPSETRADGTRAIFVSVDAKSVLCTDFASTLTKMARNRRDFSMVLRYLQS